MPSQTPISDCAGEQSPPMDNGLSSISPRNEGIPTSATRYPTDQSNITVESVSHTESHRPRFGAGAQAKEKLKFILGASEDNSSDDEPLVKNQTTRLQAKNTETLQAEPTVSSEMPPIPVPSTCLR